MPEAEGGKGLDRQCRTGWAGPRRPGRSVLHHGHFCSCFSELNSLLMLFCTTPGARKKFRSSL